MMGGASPPIIYHLPLPLALPLALPLYVPLPLPLDLPLYVPLPLAMPLPLPLPLDGKMGLDPVRPIYIIIVVYCVCVSWVLTVGGGGFWVLSKDLVVFFLIVFWVDDASKTKTVLVLWS